MDFLIIYERKQRELENAILLKIELEKRGYTCEVYQYYEGDKYNIFNINAPKVILVPHLYGSANVYRTFSRFGRSNHIVNLQFEQVLSEKWEKLGHHNPHDEAKKAIHICWGTKTRDRLALSGTPKVNLKVVGAPHLDLLRKEFRINSEKKKQEFANIFNLDRDKKWVLFLSSFTYANISDNRLKMNEAVAQTNLEYFRVIHTDSRDKILSWFENILKKDTKNIFIYRPHPDELNLDPVLKLEKDYANFRVISYSAVKEWIAVSDNIYSWYSTSVVEAHFLDKSYSILRPNTLPDSFDSVLLKHASFITNYKDFEKDYFIDDDLRKTAIDDYHINLYYQIDNETPAYKKYCNLLEDIYILEKQKYSLGLQKKIIAKIKSISVIFVYFLYKKMKINLDRYKEETIKKNFFIEWFIEMDNQIVSNTEKINLENKLKSILSKNNYETKT